MIANTIPKLAKLPKNAKSVVMSGDKIIPKTPLNNAIDTTAPKAPPLEIPSK